MEVPVPIIMIAYQSCCFLPIHFIYAKNVQYAHPAGSLLGFSTYKPIQTKPQATSQCHFCEPEALPSLLGLQLWYHL